MEIKNILLNQLQQFSLMKKNMKENIIMKILKRNRKIFIENYEF